MWYYLLGRSVGQWKRRKVSAMNKALKNENHELRQFIRKCHLWLVKIERAYVVTLNAYTKDGSRNVGANGCNLALVEMDLCFEWSKGRTIMGLRMDAKNGKVSKKEIKYTDAIINLDAIPWVTLGRVVWTMVGL